MRKLILILIFILPYLPIHAQAQGWYSGGNTKTRIDSVIKKDTFYIPSSQRCIDFFNRCTAKGVVLTAQNKAWYNDSIFYPLLNAGVIGITRAGDSLSYLHSLNLKHAQDTAVANMNLLDTSYTLVNYGGIVKTDSGYYYDGVNDWSTCNFNPVIDSSIFRLNSACLGSYYKSGRGVFWATDGTNNIIYAPASDLAHNNYFQLNSNGWSQQLNTAVIGIKTFRRASNDRYSQYLFENGNAPLSMGGSNSTVIPNNVIKLQTDGSGTYYGGLITFRFLGSGLSDQKCSAINSILNNSLKGYGYNTY